MKSFNEISKVQLDTLRAIVGNEYAYEAKHALYNKYCKDATEDYFFKPAIVLLPKDKHEVSAILSYCNNELIPVTARGAGTGLSGGALAILGGVILSVERMNKIIEIDTANFQVTVEPGVINEDLQNAVAKHGLFYPPDPASKGSCFLGGNVAHASGGPKALKYGTTRDYVLNLEIVLASGEIVVTGANTLKFSSGYNLTHLVIGSEGTLCIVTKIVFKLIPKPKENILMLASFANAIDACRAVNEIFLVGINPSVLEFIEPDGFRLASNFINVVFNIPDNVGAYLLIELDGNDLHLLNNESLQVYEVLNKFNLLDMILAEDESKKEFLWKMRRTIGEATKHNNIYKEEDTVVPRATLPILYQHVKRIALNYKFRTICYGHAGDGNLHINIMKDVMDEAYWKTEIPKAIIEIFEVCKNLNGTISGEHGIGYVQKEYLPIVASPVAINLMKGIKHVFDPNGILNPGKIF
jgi:glycolate oxidase